MSKRYPGGIIRKTPQTPSQTSAQGIWDMASVTQAVKENTWPIAGVPDPISRSLRFRSSASAYLNRTFSAPTSRRIFTFSIWTKRGELVPNDFIFGRGTGPESYLQWSTDNTLEFYDYTGSTYSFRLVTTQVFRDPAAWYHIVVAVDTTQATAANRIKMYVNGTQITAFSTATYPAQNFDSSLNTNATVYIGRSEFASNYIDGYMTEVYFVDGQALTPSSFGNTNDQTGVWQPIAYTGTYGTNGFYLPFSNTASTATLGYDFSGNSNNWTVNNISLTSGSTYDSMVDVPTQWIPYNTAGDTGALWRGNYAVMNPLNKTYSTFTLSNGNLNWTSDTVNMGAHGTFQLPTSGKYYWEVIMTANAGGSPAIGIADGLDTLGNKGIEYRTSGNKEQNGGVTGNGASAYGATWTTNDVIGVAYDADTSSGQITFYKNGSSQGVAYSSVKTNFPNGLFPAFQNNASGTTSFNINFGQRPFAYTPPSGFVTLNTRNLPTPTIGATASTTANKYFDVSLWTGTGVAQNITNSGSMQPDWVWTKTRSQANDHFLFDALRGVNNYLRTNSTGAEATVAGNLTAFNSNGFTVGTNNDVNASGRTFVGWQWRASNATAVTNTAGSITSTVSANTTAGFSIVTYTGNNTLSTVGHGLGVGPKFIIVKTRSGTDGWIVYHASLGVQYYTFLNTTDASYNNLSNYWSSTAPSSTTFGINAYGGVNTNAATYVAYCFAEVAGYSAFGSYTGNGSTDGPFIYTGFRPRFIIIRRTDLANWWEMFDTSRNPSNVVDKFFGAQTADAEYTGSSPNDLIDFNSNGFKIRSSNNAPNASGGNFIYMAFAETPFKYSLAR